MAPSIADLESDDTIAKGKVVNGNQASAEKPESRYGKPLPECWVPLYEQPSRTPTRRLRVVTVGAGFASMTLAYKLYHERDMLPLLDHVVYEMNEQMGGTWDVNRYPGVACDVPSHIYTFLFEPNPNWSAYYAAGDEILEYFQRTVEKYDLARNVKCGHRVKSAVFDSGRGQYNLEVQHCEEVIKDYCDVLVLATGFLSHWRWPAIPGLHEFRGHLMHSAAWSDDIDMSGKRVAVIGNGSSGIQIVPQLAEKVKHLTNFIREPTWITPGLGSGVIGGKSQYTYTEEEKRNFREHPEELKKFRKQIQHGSNVAFARFRKESEAQQEARKTTQDLMLDRLDGREDLIERMVPDWEVGCRRETPGPGYLESFAQKNVTLDKTGIERVVPEGILGKDGQLHEFDAIVCATGFDVSHRPPWPLIGRKGVSLAEHWKEEPLSYLSLMADSFPNLFMFSGPNAPVGHGSLMGQMDWSADYMVQWMRKMAEEDVKWMEPKPDAVDEFNAYADEIMQTLVWTGGCKSWYKNHRVDGRVTAVWPGSAISYHEMIQHLRPEDFEIKYRSKNRFKFMGHGKTQMELRPGEDLAFYITR